MHRKLPFLLLLLTACASAPDQEPKRRTAADFSIDPRCQDILRRTSAALAESPQYRFRASIAYDNNEVVDGKDVLVRYGAQTEITLSRPGQLKVSYRGDRSQQDLYIDATEASLVSPEAKIYSNLERGETIDATLDLLWEKAGVAPPLSDLVYKDAYARLAPKALGSSYLGLHDIDGRPCHHMLLFQENVDWQIWIDAGDKPLPRRLVITYWELPQAPVFTADITDWTFAPRTTPAFFRFDPPAGAIKVDAVATPSFVTTEGDQQP